MTKYMMKLTYVIRLCNTENNAQIQFSYNFIVYSFSFPKKKIEIEANSNKVIRRFLLLGNPLLIDCMILYGSNMFNPN